MKTDKIYTTFNNYRLLKTEFIRKPIEQFIKAFGSRMTAFKVRHLQPRLPKRPRKLLESFTLLFYVGKFLGIVAQDLQEFRRYKRLKRSTTGEGLIIVNIILLTINFNLMIGVFQTISYVTENSKLDIQKQEKAIIEWKYKFMYLQII